MDAVVPVILAAWNASGVVVHWCVGAFVCALILASVRAGWLCLRGVRTLKNIGRYTLEWTPASDVKVQDYLHPHRERVDLHEDRRFLLRVERREMLDDLSQEGKPWALAGPFTGIALFLTFILIGYVLLTDVRGALSGFSSSAQAEALESASESLADAVSGLGAKFFISAAGVLCSIVYLGVEAVCNRWLRAALDEVELKLRKVFASPEEYDGHLQRRHLEVLEEIRDNGRALQVDVQRLSSIEVSVQNLSSEVVLKLSRMLTNDLGERLEQIVGRAMVEVGDVAARVSEALSVELQRASAIVSDSIPQITTQLEAIGEAVSHQAQAPVEALLDRFNSAMAGGYNAETAQLGAMLREFAEVVPAMTRNFEIMGQQLLESANAQQGRGEATQQRVFENVQALLGDFHQKHTEMTSLVGRIQTETAQAATGMVKSLEQQVSGVATEFARVATKQSDVMTQRMTTAAAAHDASLDAVGVKFQQVIESLGMAERALHQSATELHSVAANATQLLSGTRAAVQAVDASTHQLRLGTEVTRSVVEGAGVVVREAQAQATTEIELTRELQAVWPKLLDVYLKSFEEKSNLLAASWRDTHNQVATMVEGTVNQLRDAAEELQTSVQGLSKVMTRPPGTHEPS